MNQNFSQNRLRWIVVVGIGSVGLFLAYLDGNMLPLMAVIFAVVILSAALINRIPPSSRVFVRRLRFSTFLVVLVVGAFNYVINPFGLYPPHFFEPLTLNTRDFKMDQYSTYSPPPHIVILGSSRSFTVDPNQIEQLWHYSAFNASVSGGTMRDFLAFERYMSQVGKLPDIFIINLAPEIFLWNDETRFVHEPDARLWNYIGEDDPTYSLRDGFYRVTRLVSKEQLDASIRVLSAKSIDRTRLNEYVADRNGMIHLFGIHLSAEDLSPNQLSNMVQLNYGNSFNQYTPDVFRLDVLRQILEIAKQQHILVIGYIPPYHPAMRDALETQTVFTANLNYITGQLDNFETEYPFHYLNFIDSQSFANGDALFADFVHPNEQASALMMQKLYDQFHSYAQY